jgi:hypothetical protein
VTHRVHVRRHTGPARSAVSGRISGPKLAAMPSLRLTLLFLAVSFPLAARSVAQNAPTPASTAGSATSSPTETAVEPEVQWKRDSDRRAEELTRRWGPGTDAALRDQILSLQQQDQEARGLIARQDGKAAPAKDLRELDRELSAKLRALIEVHGWPTVALVGLPASNAAMLLLNHTPDHVWQKALLPQLEELADAGKIDAAMLAVVVDKELVSEGKLQRYGTQFRSMGTSMRMYAVEDPATLDARRARLQLPPIAVYRSMLSRMYGLPASESVVQAPVPIP